MYRYFTYPFWLKFSAARLRRPALAPPAATRAGGALRYRTRRGRMPERSRSPRGRRGHRGGAYVRSLGLLQGPATNWTTSDEAAVVAGREVPEWYRRLRVQLSRAEPAEKARSASLLRDLAAALDVESGAAN